MGVGRPPEGLRHVQRLSGSREGKKRLRWILASMMGECTVSAACEALGIRAARFHQLRSQALQGALKGLTPGEPGRPRRRDEAVLDSKVEKMERRIRRLQLDLEAVQLRADLQLLEHRPSQKNQTRRK